MREDGEEGDGEQCTGAERNSSLARWEEPVEQPQDCDDGRREEGPGEDSVKRPPVKLDPVDGEG